MEPEGSLPHSQAPAICPCLSPYQSSPHFPSCFVTIRFNIIAQSTPRSTKWSLSQSPPPKPRVHLSCPPYVPHAPPISLTCSQYRMSDVWAVPSFRCSLQMRRFDASTGRVGGWLRHGIVIFNTAQELWCFFTGRLHVANDAILC